MKKLKILLLSLIIPVLCSGQGAYHDYNEVIVRAGLINSNLRYGDNIGGTINMSYIPLDISVCGIGWNANFIKTKDFYSISPLGTGATLLAVFCNAIFSNAEDLIWKTLCLMSVESMGVYIPIGEYFELQPYWNLLRLSKWREEKIIVTGAFGLAATTYINRFSITLFGEYSYGYGNSNWWGEVLSNALTDSDNTYYNKYKKPRTPFKGWIYGLTLGFSFNI